ncbi:OsmC family peroxiredoxin [Myroides pelagicus]|uniref:OsmC family peroxiredoxin n=1 Tax=Myroides pelagicus TaxID=270914 RepID=A0A7K1GMA0_9FLAO|nr:OsmC family peroxiredoxin [Myroides pelagicus]MTH29938.1 OsmC family peroxiredoxin [Myroides pelagicus]
MKATISANWSESFKKGEGVYTSENPLLNGVTYHFMNRPNKQAVLPEEFLAAAYSGCFNMTLAMLLTTEKYEITSLDTSCDIHYDENKLLKAVLNVQAKVATIDKITFEETAKKAKQLCPIGQGFAFPTELNINFE